MFAHLYSYIFEFSDSVKHLTAPRDLINDTTRYTKFRSSEITRGAKVNTIFCENIIPYNQYYLETPWRS